MTMKKRILTGVTSLSVAISMSFGFIFNSYADNISDDEILQIEYVPKTIEEQYSEYLNSGNATPEGISVYEEKLKEYDAIINGTFELPSSMSRGIHAVGMSFYEQEKNYYCGPASVQQMYAYFKGTSNLPTQTQLASKDEGNTENPVGSKVKTLNTDYYDKYSLEKETAHFFALHYCKNFFDQAYLEAWRYGAYTNSTQLYELIGTSIERDNPVLGHITGATTSNWRYSTSGHYLVYRGYTDGDVLGEKIYILDPWKQGHGISNGSYSETASRVYTVTDRIIYG